MDSILRDSVQVVATEEYRRRIVVGSIRKGIRSKHSMEKERVVGVERMLRTFLNVVMDTQCN